MFWLRFFFFLLFVGCVCDVDLMGKLVWVCDECVEVDCNVGDLNVV